jgi:pyrroline-5-carboxylate reductase
MGSTVVSALASSNVTPATSIVVSEIDTARRQEVVSKSGAVAGRGLPEDVSDCRAIVLAVKPQVFPAVASAMRPSLEPKQLVISIMAGVTLDTLEGKLGTSRVVRSMPNTPAQIGQGLTVWMAGKGLDAEDRRLTREILAALGTEIEVNSEPKIDAATAVHGSGPAYVFLVAEAWIDAAVAIGLERDLATTLVRETLLGSTELWIASKESPAALRHAVTSPGGTTAAALEVFEEREVRDTFMEAVSAAFRRAKELN